MDWFLFLFICVASTLFAVGISAFITYFLAFVYDLCTGRHNEAIGSFISSLTNLPAASAPFWMFASVMVACLTAIYISSKK